MPECDVDGWPTYRPGTATALVGSSIVVWLDVDAAHPLVAQTWQLVGRDGDCDDVLEVIISAGLRAVPGFCIVDRRGDGRMVARGTATAWAVTSDGETRVTRSGGWVDHELTATDCVQIGPADSPGADLPVLGGIVAVAAVRIPLDSRSGDPAHQPHDIPGPASPPAMPILDHHPTGEAPLQQSQVVPESSDAARASAEPAAVDGSNAAAPPAQSSATPTPLSDAGQAHPSDDATPPETEQFETSVQESANDGSSAADEIADRGAAEIGLDEARSDSTGTAEVVASAASTAAAAPDTSELDPPDYQHLFEVTRHPKPVLASPPIAEADAPPSTDDALDAPSTVLKPVAGAQIPRQSDPSFPVWQPPELIEPGAADARQGGEAPSLGPTNGLNTSKQMLSPQAAVPPAGVGGRQDFIFEVPTWGAPAETSDHAQAASPERDQSAALLPAPVADPVAKPQTADADALQHPAAHAHLFPEAERSALDGAPLEKGPNAVGHHSGMTVSRSQLKATGAGPDGPMVQAARCARGHLTPAHGTLCRVCDEPVPAQQPFWTPRPVLGRLVLPGGDIVTLDRGAILGREPRLPVSWVGEQPHLIRVSNPTDDVSRQHVEIWLDMFHVLVRDLGSQNGTELVLPDGERRTLRAHQPVPIGLGTTIVLAGVMDVRFTAIE